MKKSVLWMTVLLLLVLTCVPAFASVGDRVLFRASSDGYSETGILNLLPCGDGFIIAVRENNRPELVLYTDIKAQPESFLLDEKSLQEMNAESETRLSAENWFFWNNGVYALVRKVTYNGDSDHTEFIVRKAMLDDGQVILEDSGFPELDLSGMVKTENDGYESVRNLIGLFATGDHLILVLGEEEPETLDILNLQDGFCTEYEPDNCCEAAPGPNGTLMITKADWATDSSTATVQVCSIDPDNLSEKLLTEISGCTGGMITPCYNPAADTLYFIRGGELYAMPQFDPERIESVNTCPQLCTSAVSLPDGFVLIKTADSVILKNTDPARLGNITLRILNRGRGNTIPETIYAMGSVRGDISVIQQEEGEIRHDILQAMLTRDDSIDIYVLHYDSNEFQAFLSRRYLPDLGENAKISENTERLYPYIQDAVLQNGKIIGVPVCFVGTALGVDREVWKQIGGSAEELPKTWSRFFDWLEVLPERLEGQDVRLNKADRVFFRGEILQMLLNQYEIRMEHRGEKDYAFASSELCDLVHRLNSVDYDALRLPDNWKQDESYQDPNELKQPLLNTSVFSPIVGESWNTLLALSFVEGEEATLPVEMDIAFVNPFSVHREEAMEFLALAMENLDIYDKYNAYADMTEPVRYPEFEEEMQWLRDVIDTRRKNLEKAKNDEEKDRINEEILLLENNMKKSEENDWKISPADVERYQKRQDMLMIRGYDFFNDLFTADTIEENHEEFERLFWSERAPEDILEDIDRQIRMIGMEGN